MSDQVEPSKGALRAAQAIYKDDENLMANKHFIHISEVPNLAAVIDRETKSPQMAAFILKVAKNGRLWRVLDEDQWNDISREAERLLSELEVKP